MRPDENAVGVGIGNDLIGRFQFDFFHHGFGKPFAQIGAETGRLEHGHVNRVDFHGVERLVANLISAQPPKRANAKSTPHRLS